MLWDGKKSDFYRLQKGVRQGNPASGILFNLFIDDVTDFISSERVTPISLDSAKLFLIKYADDVVLLSASEPELQI